MCATRIYMLDKAAVWYSGYMHVYELEFLFRNTEILSIIDWPVMKIDGDIGMKWNP